MATATLAAIHRYPVKSMAGENLESVQLGSNGLPGDRSWAVRDEVRGGIRGAKQIGGLMGLASRFPAPPAASGSSPAEILFPDGSTGTTGDEDISERISAAVGHEISLWPLLPADALDHYRRGAPSHDDFDTQMRAVFAREAHEPLPDLSVFPPELAEYESPPGTYFDAFPLLVVSTASLDTMQERAPDSKFDVRRFRPNLVVADTEGSDPFPEVAWAGRRLRIGEAILKMEIECPRCVMTTRGFADLEHDPSVMRALVKETGGNLGLYASIEKPGAIRLGEPCELL